MNAARLRTLADGSGACGPHDFCSLPRRWLLGRLSRQAYTDRKSAQSSDVKHPMINDAAMQQARRRPLRERRWARVNRSGDAA
jgi:hypothetical protein